MCVFSRTLPFPPNNPYPRPAFSGLPPHGPLLELTCGLTSPTTPSPGRLRGRSLEKSWFVLFHPTAFFFLDVPISVKFSAQGTSDIGRPPPPPFQPSPYQLPRRFSLPRSSLRVSQAFGGKVSDLFAFLFSYPFPPCCFLTLFFLCRRTTCRCVQKQYFS